MSAKALTTSEPSVFALNSGWEVVAILKICVELVDLRFLGLKIRREDLILEICSLMTEDRSSYTNPPRAMGEDGFKR